MKATRDRGNVFSDLGFSLAEARNLQMRAQLMTALRKFVEKKGLTQAEAAKGLKITQPRVSDLMRGKISRFSLDTLVSMASDAGLEVDLRITAKSVSKRVA
jgi:predicted XRE-type DNA-binding protein